VKNLEAWKAVQLVFDHTFTSGVEGPSCDAQGLLYACNYERNGMIGRVDEDGRHELFLGLPEGSIGNGMVFDSNEIMYIADYVGHNVLKVDMKNKKLMVHAHEPKMNQPNDLAIMQNGIIFASDPDWSNGTGQLWRVGVDGKTTLLETNMGTTNGLEVSPDEKTLYVNETVQRCIWSYDLDEQGNISSKRLFYQFDEFYLDGMRCDIKGNLYVTRYGGSRVAVFSPSGEYIRDISLHGTDCTNIAFGGEDGCTCFITVADKGHIEMFRTDTPGRSWNLLAQARKRRSAS
jgi:gluconolactonase